MKTRNLILICTLFGASWGINAQVNLDSLFAIWNDANQPDTVRLEAIHGIAWDGYRNTNPDSSFYFAQLGYDLAKAIGHIKWMALALNTQGGSCFAKGDYDKAFDYWTLSANNYEAIGDSAGVSKAMANIGNVYQKKGDPDKAFEYFFQSLKINEALDDKRVIGHLLSLIGQLYYRQGNVDQAMSYLDRSLNIGKEIEDFEIIAKSQNGIGVLYLEAGEYLKALEVFAELLAYHKSTGDKVAAAGTLSNIGNVYMGQRDLPKALENTKLALNAFAEYGIPYGESGASRNVGMIYMGQGDYALALEYLNRSLSICKKMDAKQIIAEVQVNIAQVYALQGNHAKAISFGTQAMALCKETGALKATMENALTLTSSYKATGKYRQALEMNELFFQTRDSLNSEKNQKAIIQQQIKSDYEKQKAIDDVENEKRVAIETQKKENQQKLSIAIGIGLLLISLLALVILNRLKVTRQQKAIIEEQKKKVEQSEKYKEQFLANMSHEIRTPMHAISGMVKILERNAHPPSQDIYLNAMRTSSDNLVVILNDVLDLSKIEAGKLDIENITIEPAMVMENVRQILNYKAEEKGLVLSCKIGEGVPQFVMGDPTRLNQILINLAGNAIKFTEKGKVDILLEKENGHLKFSIKDTGIGISKNRIGNIFGAFQQANDSISRHYGGTGLGLSISKQLVELQNGKIWVESEENQGSTFFVELPLVAAAADAIDQNLITGDKLKTMAASLKGIRILLAEDNEFNQMIAQDDLSYYIEEVKIDSVKNGALAVEKFKTGDYDLILMDVQMPEMNGFEAARMIREIEEKEGKGNAIPIIAMTASLLKSEVDNCYAAGMDNYIPKPYKAEELIGPIFKEIKR
ncbi:MAG: tetratricopeptide repeat protein [Saprospiraceae bacterium]